MIKTQVILIILFAVFVNKIWAQAGGPPPGAEASGNLSLQGSSQDIYNIDLFAGTASITIPIYHYSIDGLDLGVSLNYGTKGIRVDQGATSVGLGWNIDAGGYIERSASGIEDEVTLPASGGASEFRGYNVTHSTSVSNESEHDLFTAVFGGRTIRFTLHATSTEIQASTSPKSEVKIKVFYDGSPINTFFPANIGSDENDHLIKFNIVDEKGNEFFFERGDYEARNYQTTVYYPTQKWVLTKIVTYEGNEINYEYQEYDNMSVPYYKSEKVTEGVSYTYNNGSGSATVNEIFQVEENNIVNWTGTMTHIKKIIYPNNTVVYFDLETNTNLKRCDLVNTYVLNSISIESKYDNNIKNRLKFNMNYAYFNSLGSEISYSSPCSTIASSLSVSESVLRNKLRLKLKSIDKIGTDNSTSERFYSFDYNDTIPERFSPSQDMYGYYNGNSVTPLTLASTTHYLSIPYHSFTLSSGTTSYGVDKTPNYPHTRAGILKKVINGYGGIMELYYKAHSLSDAGVYNPTNTPYSTGMSSTNTFDGLCLQKIVYKDGFTDDNTVTHRFEYSNGVRFFRNLYFWTPIKLAGLSNHSPSLLWNPDIIQRTWQNNYVNPIEFVHGCNHGYSNVTVIKEGYQGAQLSKKEYTFSNLIEGSSTRLIDYKIVINDITFPCYEIKSNEMGLPLVVKDYTGNTLVSEVYNTYRTSTNPTPDNRPQKTYSDHSNTVLPSYSIFDVWDLNTNKNVMQYVSDHYYSWSAVEGSYRHFKYEKQLLSSVYTKTKSGSAYMESTLDYMYDDRDNVKSVWWTDSRGVKFHKDFVYNYNGNTNSTRQHVFAQGIWKKNSTTDSVLLNYEETLTNNLTPVTFYSARSIKVTQPALYANSTNITADKEFGFDNKNNVIETRYNDQERYDSYVWDTYMGQKIATVTNAKYEDIAYTSFEGLNNTNASSYDKGNWTLNSSSVVLGTSTLSNKTITGRYCYNMQPNSTIQKTLNANKEFIFSCWADIEPIVKLDGNTVTLTQSLSWNGWKLYTANISTTTYNQTLTIEDPNPTVSNVGFIDELRLYPADASMTTLTYEPLFGISSVCDDRNNVIYSEYDVMGRVKIVRDFNGKIISQTEIVKQGNNN